MVHLYTHIFNDLVGKMSLVVVGVVGATKSSLFALIQSMTLYFRDLILMR